jgi:hypothetical protein
VQSWFSYFVVASIYVMTEEEIYLRIRSGVFRLLRKCGWICVTKVKRFSPQTCVMVANGANDTGRDDASIRIGYFS